MLEIDLTINGQQQTVSCEPTATLLDVLRGPLGLMGAKLGCGYGICGACTVLKDGLACRACLQLAADLEGTAIETIESLGHSESLSPLQHALVQQGAVQCGFCTPGVVMSLEALRRIDPSPSQEAVRKALDGNLCRCTGYQAIVEAVCGDQP